MNKTSFFFALYSVFTLKANLLICEDVTMRNMQETLLSILEKKIINNEILEIINTVSNANTGVLSIREKDHTESSNQIQYDFQDTYVMFHLKSNDVIVDFFIEYDIKADIDKFMYMLDAFVRYAENKPKEQDFLLALSKDEISLNELSYAFTNYCKAFGLPEMSADELYVECMENFPFHMNNLNSFMNKWEETTDIEQIRYIRN